MRHKSILNWARIILVSCIFYPCADLSAQGYNQIRDLTPQALTVPSPDAFSLGKYGFGKIGKYTGSTGVSVPIHQIQFEELSIPIELRYNMGGLRPAEEASWIGLGWDLSASAVITRKVNGGDDFNPTYGINNQLGWIYQPDLAAAPLTSVNWSGPLVDNFRYQSGPCGSPDTQPDLFTINLFGKTYRFVLINKAANGGQVGTKVLDDQNIIVYYEIGVGAGNFQVVDDLGYRYHFTVKETSANTSGGCPNMTTSWFLSAVYSPRGSTIGFSYRSNMELTMSHDNTPEQGSAILYSNLGPIPPPSVPGSSLNKSINGLNYLTSITYNGEVIEFTLANRTDLNKSTTDIIGGVNLNNSPLRLNTIIVSYNSVIKKTITFYQSYFDSDVVSNVTKFQRLKLDSVNVNGLKYKFGYISPNSLPDKTTKSVDYWGYYNGKSNANRYPKYYRYAGPSAGWTTIPGGNLTSDWNFSKIGMLERVDYPTGGYTVYEYEGHKASVHINDFGNEYSGGVEVTYVENNTSNIYNGMYGQTVEYQFSIDESVQFLGNSSPVANWLKLDLAITTGNRYPVPPINSNDPNIYSVAAELINMGTNTVVFSTIYKDYTDACPGTALCGTGSHKYFTGTLPAGNYKVKLYGTINSLDTELHLKIPQTFIAGASSAIDKEVGGVRVKSVRDYDEFSALSGRRDYSYLADNGSSSGGLMGIPVFSQERGFLTCNDQWQPVSASYLVISSNPVNSISQAAQGSHIGYSQVEEKFVSTTTPTNSFRLKTAFTNSSPSSTPWAYPSLGSLVCDGVNFISVDAPSAIQGTYSNGYSVLNGNVLKEESYTIAGTLVKKIENVYSISTVSGFGGAATFICSPCNGATSSTWPISAYRVEHYPVEKWLLTSTTVTEYDQSDTQVTTVAKTYNSKWLEKTSSVVGSDNKTILTTNYYVHEYTDATSQVLNTFNIGVSKALKSETTVNGNLVFGNVATLDATGLIDRLYRHESTTLAAPPTHSSSVVVPANYVEASSYLYHTTGAKLRQTIGRDGVPKAYTWGYQQHYETAEFVGALYNEIFYTSFEGEEGADSPEFDAGTGRFSKMNGYSKNLTGLTPNKDYVLAYLLKSGNDWLPQFVPITSTSGGTASISISTGQVDEIRFYPKGSLVTTYTYNPLVGLEHKVDPNLKLTRFEYDALGRLTLIKDHKKQILKQYKYHLLTEY